MASEQTPKRARIERGVVLTRHGETALNVQKRLRGRADPPLSVRGADEVVRVATALAELSPSRLLSSPRRRAIETAHAIADATALRVHVEIGLDDVDYGLWTGLTEDEVRTRWPAELALFRQQPQLTSFPAGESITQLATRAQQTLDAALALDGVSVLVTHDIVIRLLLCHALAAPLTTMNKLEIDVASTTGLIWGEDAVVIGWINDTAHLRPGSR